MNFNSIINEMAAIHFDDEIGTYMVNNEVEKAVMKYIKNILSRKGKLANFSSATTKKIKAGNYSKGLKISKDILKKIPVERWDEFDKIYKNKVSNNGVKNNKSKTMKGKEVKTRSGESVIITSGQKQQKIKDKLEKNLIKIIKETQAEKEKATSPLAKAKFDDALRALTIMYDGLQVSRTGKALIPGDSKKLRERYKKISSEMAKKIEAKKNKKVTESVEDDKFLLDIDEFLKELSEFLKITKDEEIKKIILGQIDKVKKIAVDYKKEKGMVESVKEFTNLPSTIKERLIMEAEEYKGFYFMENYTMSTFLRTFVKDTEIYGDKLTRDLYKDLYGENINEVLQYVTEDFKKEIKNTKSLIFEGCSNIDTELTESIWSIVKSVGGGALGILGKFLKAGAPWAKTLLKTGASFFASSSIAQIAVPAILLAGSIGGGVKLINKIRKKSKLNKLSDEQMVAFKKATEQSKEKLRGVI